MNNAETMKHARAALGKTAADVAVDATVEKLGNALAGHTPGPYHANAIHKGRIVGDETTSSPIDHIEICANNATVARVYRPRDVALFRAAPELLAALRLAESSLSTYAKTGAFTAGQPSGWLLRQLSASIARAEGGAA